MIFVAFTLSGSKKGKIYFASRALQDVLNDTNMGTEFEAQQFSSYEVISLEEATVHEFLGRHIVLAMKAIKEEGRRSFCIGRW